MNYCKMSEFLFCAGLGVVSPAELFMTGIYLNTHLTYCCFRSDQLLNQKLCFLFVILSKWNIRHFVVHFVFLYFLIGILCVHTISVSSLIFSSKWFYSSSSFFPVC